MGRTAGMAGAVGLALLMQCRGATEMTLDVHTDVRCESGPKTGIAAGPKEAIEGADLGASTDACSGDAIGTLVLVPSGGDGDAFGVKVVMATVPGGKAEDCAKPGSDGKYAKGCIVARRSLRYLPHEGLKLRVDMRAACVDVACSPTETCVKGGCTSDEIPDPSACAGGVCDEGSLGPPTSVDGGADAIADGGSDAADAPDDADASVDGGPTVYHRLDDPANWATFDLGANNLGGSGYAGAVFDGRYLYFVPATIPPSVLRYDTTASFAAASSWTAYALPVQSTYKGGTYDGRYVYFAPHEIPTGQPSGAMVRYDTTGPFADVASWGVFDATPLDVNAKGYLGAAFDGKQAYFVPFEAVIGGTPADTFTRFTGGSDFLASASWQVFHASALASLAQQFAGATFDGQYVYLAPAVNQLAPRYDTTLPLGVVSSWQSFDTSALTSTPTYIGAVFDGRYVYLVPGTDIATAGDEVIRYDKTLPYLDDSSWQKFAPVPTLGKVGPFRGGVFDGRYVYLVPFGSGNPNATVRYDTTAPFATTTSWSAFDVATIASLQNASFFGGAFDGRYVYLVPLSGDVVVRFDARSPSLLPPSIYGGSFL